MPVGYPMVDEGDATGRVAAVYGRILQHLPMVPSLFKSLATCPPYLRLAWEQAEDVWEDPALSAGARRLTDAATGVVPAPRGREAVALLDRFVGPLARMAIVTAGLRLALDDELDAPPAGAIDADARGDRLAPQLEVPSTDRLDPALVGAVRRDLATPIVNSVWRVAADGGVLADVWQQLGPHIGTPVYRERCSEVTDTALATARQVPWRSAASPSALERAGVADAAAGMGAIVDAYLATLPRVLVLVAASADGRTGGSGDDR